MTDYQILESLKKRIETELEEWVRKDDFEILEPWDNKEFVLCDNMVEISRLVNSYKLRIHSFNSIIDFLTDTDDEVITILKAYYKA